jgi:hypothetical protein
VPEYKPANSAPFVERLSVGNRTQKVKEKSVAGLARNIALVVDVEPAKDAHLGRMFLVGSKSQEMGQE